MAALLCDEGDEMNKKGATPFKFSYKLIRGFGVYNK